MEYGTRVQHRGNSAMLLEKKQERKDHVLCRKYLARKENNGK